MNNFFTFFFMLYIDLHIYMKPEQIDVFKG